MAKLQSLPIGVADDATVDVHGLCCDDADCAMRVVPSRDFLQGFPLHADHPQFSLTVTLDGSQTGSVLMRTIAAGLARISADGYIRAVGVIGSGADH